jgi:hypothetical protein
VIPEPPVKTPKPKRTAAPNSALIPHSSSIPVPQVASIAGKAKHLSTLILLFPHHSGIVTILPTEKHKNIISKVKLYPESKAAARI